MSPIRCPCHGGGSELAPVLLGRSPAPRYALNPRSEHALNQCTSHQLSHVGCCYMKSCPLPPSPKK